MVEVKPIICPRVGLSLLALPLAELVQVRGNGDVVLLPLLVLGEVRLLLFRSVLHLAGEELFNEAPPGRRNAEAQVLWKKMSSSVTRVTSGIFHKSSGFNQETVAIRGRVTSGNPPARVPRLHVPRLSAGTGPSVLGPPSPMRTQPGSRPPRRPSC